MSTCLCLQSTDSKTPGIFRVLWGFPGGLNGKFTFKLACGVQWTQGELRTVLPVHLAEFPRCFLPLRLVSVRQDDVLGWKISVKIGYFGFFYLITFAPLKRNASAAEMPPLWTPPVIMTTLHLGSRRLCSILLGKWWKIRENRRENGVLITSHRLSRFSSSLEAPPRALPSVTRSSWPLIDEFAREKRIFHEFSANFLPKKW